MLKAASREWPSYAQRVGLPMMQEPYESWTEKNAELAEDIVEGDPYRTAGVIVN